MKKLLCCSLVAFFALTAFGQNDGAMLIVRADDMGSFRSANIACMESYKDGVITSVEVMAVAPWFPEAARLLRENPGLDAGLHLTFTSEWDNVKWHPLTSCPSLTDENGYFLPMMYPNKNYPGLAIKENKWDINEVEREARAQIELALKNVPHISHITGHMGSNNFAPEVIELMQKLSAEYHLPVMDRSEAVKMYDFSHCGYAGPSKTSGEKEASFIAMLGKLERGKRYVFLDHPALDNEEMQTVGHIGYENVAADRQGVTDLFTSDRVKQALKDNNINLISYNDMTKSLPRGEASAALEKAFGEYMKAVEKSGEDLHSIMIVKDGDVVKEQWLSKGERNEPHVLNSVSKTFTATAVGLAVADGLLDVNDKVISFFPDKLPAEVSDNLKNLEIRHLLTMTSGHDVDPTSLVRKKGNEDADWVATFLAAPLDHEPGTFYCYNSLGTYVLSAIVQKVTGEKVIDYLYPRLFRPLGIVGAIWQESPQGINCGGWGLYLKTEDLAKMGQLILQNGEWNGEQLIPASWIAEATSKKVDSLPAGARKDTLKIKAKDSDWLQGYGYQMWRCRHNGVRADGANGQYIIVLPEKDAVIAMTADINNMQEEINLVWKYLLPAL